MLNNFPTDCELLIASIFGRIEIIERPPRNKYSIKWRSRMGVGISSSKNPPLSADGSRRFTILGVFVEQSGKLCLEILREEI